ncbi:hypothetical protein [Candidatus Methylomirabilis sp.]|uniref:hypothetical protein n=1 Tax=Candidatus Methylomirabilis sp. TaxID=2032687 RepID=UPI003C74B428
MPAPGEHKTVQARILAYVQEIGWTYVPRDEAEARRMMEKCDSTMKSVIISRNYTLSRLITPYSDRTEAT